MTLLILTKKKRRQKQKLRAYEACTADVSNKLGNKEENKEDMSIPSDKTASTYSYVSKPHGMF